MKYSSRLLLLVLVLAVIATRLVAIYQTDVTSVYTTPLVDDSYYYFALGQHLADGDGIKVDGVHDTTGFQPLWGFLIAIPYQFFPNNLQTPITFIQLIGMMVSIGTTVLLFSLARRFVPAVAAAVITAIIMLSPYSIATSINGMETALATMMTIALFYSLYEVYQHPRQSAYIVMGLICGASFLARVDTAFLTLAALLIMVVKPPQSGKRWIAPLIVAATAVIPVLPWAVIAFSMGKSPMPESGEAVRIIAQLLGGTQAEPINPSFTALLDPSRTAFYAQKFIRFLAEFALRIDFSSLQRLIPIPFDAGIGGFLLIFIGMLIFALPIMLASKQSQYRVLIYVWAFYVFMMFVLYPVVVQSDWFFNRYVAPLSAMFTFFSALYIFKEYGKGWQRAARIALGIGIFVSYGLILLNDPVYQWILVGSRARPSESHYDAVEWINTNLPDDALIGGFQTGLVSYYSTPTVINLDGKVNADARHALIEATMGEYLCASGVSYIVDQPLIVQHLLVERTQDWDDRALKLLYTAKGEPDNPMQIYQLNCDALNTANTNS